MPPVRLPPVLVAVLCVGAWAHAQDDGEAPDVSEEAEVELLHLDNPAFPVVVDDAPAQAEASLTLADLSPYFADGPLAEAKALFDARRYAAAAQRLDAAPPSTPARFLRALTALRLRDWARAGPDFEALAADYPALADRCFVHAGQAYEAARDWEAAERMYARVSPTTRLAVDAGLGRARALLRLKKSGDALALVSEWAARPAPPWGRDVGAAALLAQADILARRGNSKASREALVALWAGHPMARREVALAEAKLGDLSAVGPAALVTRGEALIDAHRNAQGLQLVEPLLPSLRLPDPLACRAHFAVGKGYRKLRQHRLAAQALAPVVKQCADAQLRVKALYTLGFSQSIVSPATASATWLALAKDYPEHPLADDALFFAADVDLRRGETAKAVERLVDVVDDYGDGDFAAEALFKLFWVRWQEGNLGDAAVFLEEMEGRSAAGDGQDVSRARYWRGRVLERQGRTDAALEAWDVTARAHPATYYGLLALERVEALAPERGAALREAVKAAPRADDLFPLRLGPLGDDRRFRAAVELVRLGLGELVPGELMAIDRSALPARSVRAMVVVLSRSGMERQAHGLARLWLKRDFNGPITAANRAFWEIAYPKAFRDLVVKHAGAADGLDPDLLQALMREESALDPKALSWAGALGLCQLMPPTAAEVAAELKLKRPSQAQLLEPDLNVQLGARYLANLLLRARGVKPFALAGYNAGESAVRRWRAELGDDDLAAWVEQIPIQETRGYVKRVLRSYGTYQLLYAPESVARTVAPFTRATASQEASRRGAEARP